ncbi:putative superfamily II helicase [Aeromonas phage LAh_6]|uniref:Putative superfamily II helicase n=1 Tax=Aeromonas phage LAh_6 TaxID=2591030 RepID=A0A514A022_9CAUD|nr:putative superfamily II helicase [Aeromonas phage LAh_6]QDH46627.1 putative superfamily II helicase [Aeromonas phage LAh_6]
MGVMKQIFECPQCEEVMRVRRGYLECPYCLKRIYREEDFDDFYSEFN